MSNVFGEIDDQTDLFEFYKKEFEWTNVYLICNINGDSFGLIRVVPELDNYISFHGIGWPNKSKLSRMYFKAWIGIHNYFFNKCSLIRSNCNISNYNAIHVLDQTGYVPTFINSKIETNQNINFTLKKSDFLSSKLYKLFKPDNYLIKDCKDDIDLKNVDYKSFDFDLKNKKSDHLKVSKIKNHLFKSEYINNRQQLILKHEIVEMKHNKIKVYILKQFFKNNIQFNIEFNGVVNILNIIKLKKYFKQYLKSTPIDLIYIYSDENFAKLLMMDDFIYMGFDKERNMSVWRVF